MSRSERANQANLERIRNNQRRSRQKRKEHLQDLQDKLRLCELQGVEASAEIQVAARKVAEENKKLRTLLTKHGIPHVSIEEYLASGTVAPPRLPLSDNYHTTPVGSGVQTLERLLEPRRPVFLDPCAPFPVPSNTGGGPRSMDSAGNIKSRETSIASVSSVWDSAPSQVGVPPSVPSQRGQLQPPQYSTAATSGAPLSKTDGAMVLKGLGSIMEDPPRTASSNLNSAGAIVGDGHAQPPYGYDMHLLPSPSPYGQPQDARQRLSLHSPGAPPTVPSNYMQTPATENNCAMATEIISGMTGIDPHHVRSQLGCVPGMDCHIDAVTFNNAVNRYATPTTNGM